MVFVGHVENGNIVLDESATLPEGAKVRIEVLAEKAGTGDWDAAMKAARELEDYDFDAYRRQREYDLQHARDHQP
jgi:hypothetical protein